MDTQVQTRWTRSVFRIFFRVAPRELSGDDSPMERRSLSRLQIDQEFKAWLRDTAQRRGLSQADVAWAFPFQVHPKTVESWFRGRTRPNYHQLVGLCVALGVLPPVLTDVCRRATG